MEKKSLKKRIQIEEESKDNGNSNPSLKSTKASSEQAWCAYTYYIAQEPVNNIYGLFKIICTGPSAQAVTDQIHTLIDSGELESDLPFIGVRRTGCYVKLIPGGDPKAEKEKYEPAGKQVKTMAMMDRHRKRAQIEKEFRERQKMIYDEIEKQEDPFSYDRYVILRSRMIGYQQNKQVIQDRDKVLDEVIVKVTKDLKTVEAKMDGYKKRYGIQMNREVDEVQKEQDKMLEERKERMKEQTKKKKIGRNDPCSCGSGKKYKKCCNMGVEKEVERSELKEQERSDLEQSELERSELEQSELERSDLERSDLK